MNVLALLSLKMRLTSLTFQAHLSKLNQLTRGLDTVQNGPPLLTGYQLFTVKSGVTKKLHIPTARNDEQIDAYRRPGSHPKRNSRSRAQSDSIQNQDLGDLGQDL